MLASELTLIPTGVFAMPTQAEPGFRADAEKLLSGEAHQGHSVLVCLRTASGS